MAESSAQARSSTALSVSVCRTPAPLPALQVRQMAQSCEPIYTLLDNGRPQAALQAVDQLLARSSSSSSTSAIPSSSSSTSTSTSTNASPSPSLALTPAAHARAHPLAEALRSIALQRVRRPALALATALRLAEQGWGTADGDVVLPLTDVLARSSAPQHRTAAAVLLDVCDRAASAGGSGGGSKAAGGGGGGLGSFGENSMGERAFEAACLAREWSMAQGIAARLQKAAAAATAASAGAAPTSLKGKAAAALSAARKKQGGASSSTPTANANANAAEKYFWWSMTCYLLLVSRVRTTCVQSFADVRPAHATSTQARDRGNTTTTSSSAAAGDPAAALALPLAERMMLKHTDLGARLAQLSPLASPHTLSLQASPSVSSSSEEGAKEKEKQERERELLFFTGSPQEIEQYQLLLTALVRQAKWREAWALLELPAGRMHAGLPVGPLPPSAAANGSSAAKSGSGGDESANGTASGSGSGNGVTAGNPDLKPERWRVMRALRLWRALRDEMVHRMRHGDRDWEVVRLLVEASVQLQLQLSAGGAASDEPELGEATRAFLESLLPESVASMLSAPSADAAEEGEGGSGGGGASGSKNKKKRQAANKRRAAAMRERPLFLARLEVLRQFSQAAATTTSTSPAEPQAGHQAQLLACAKQYFDLFASKRCAYEDLRPYALLLGAEERAALSAALEPAASRGAPIEDEPTLARHINAHKLRRLLLPRAGLTPEAELANAQTYCHAYVRGLPVGKALPDTEMQPADDLAFLSAEALVHAWHLRLQAGSGADADAYQPLVDAVTLLHYALGRSPKGYVLRLLLLRILIQLGAFSAGAAHFAQLGVKSVQQDSMAHWLVERCGAAFASADYDVKEHLAPFAEIYEENDEQTPRFFARALQYGNYSRAEETLDFFERLDRSLGRMLLETERMLAFLSSGDKDGARGAAERVLAVPGPAADQRDFDILPSYLPDGCGATQELLSGGPRVTSAYCTQLASLVLGKEATAQETSDVSSGATEDDKALETDLALPQFNEAELLVLAGQPDLEAVLKQTKSKHRTPLQLLQFGEAALRVSVVCICA